MTVLTVLLYIVEVAVCLLLGLVVMLQKPKEGGLGGAFGGGALEASLGADAGNVLIKATAILGTIFLLNTLILACITARDTGSVVSGQDEAAKTAETLPATDAAPGGNATQIPAGQ